MDTIKLSDLRIAFKLLYIPIDIGNIPHLSRALSRAFFTDGKGKVYLWQILARPSRNVRLLYGMGKKSFEALEAILREKCGDEIVNQWLET